jgi:EAL domain-containing protein (putative c-di-GMP-specific phosphodiesterase class I)
MAQETLRSPSGVEPRLRVLVADDDELFTRSARRVLGAAGAEIVVVAGCDAAILAIIAEPFDVILSDLFLPGTAGLDLLRTIRVYDPELPVVLLTAPSEVQRATEALELGAASVLEKPSTAERLVHAVKRAAKTGRLARAKQQPGRAATVVPPPSSARERARLAANLDHAIETLWIAFQPIVSVGGRRVIGYEALLRTAEPSLPSPAAVLGAAERRGRLRELGRKIRLLAAESFRGAPEDALLFLNLHPLDLLDPVLSADSAPLSRIAGRVVLEVTERTAAGEIPGLEARLHILRYMGFRIAVDDLGAGQGGLSSLSRLEPELVKLDMGLVRDVHASSERQRLIGALTSLCGQRKMTVIAGGVELVEEREEILRLGCDLQQGFLFGRPGSDLAVAV